MSRVITLWGGLVSAVRGNWRGGVVVLGERVILFGGGGGKLVWFILILLEILCAWCFSLFRREGGEVFAYLLTFSDPLIWKWDERRARQIGIYSLFYIS